MPRPLEFLLVQRKIPGIFMRKVRNIEQSYFSLRQSINNYFVRDIITIFVLSYKKK
jgi:hypothetical protein